MVTSNGRLQAVKSHSRLLVRMMPTVKTGHSADDDLDDSSTADTGRTRSFQTIGSRTIGPVSTLLALPTQSGNSSTFPC